MEQYLSTYRKDFMWPYVKTFPNRQLFENHIYQPPFQSSYQPSYQSSHQPPHQFSHQPSYQLPHQSPDQSQCFCGTEPGGSMPPKEYVAANTNTVQSDNYQWSRLGPMAPLLDPKLYPVKMGPPPEFEITRYDQPNTYLKKLQEKYPHLYNVLENAPPDEMIMRVDEDRLRSTYQVDYSHIDEQPSGDYEKILAQERMTKSLMDPYSGRSPLLLDCRGRSRPPNRDCDDTDESFQPGGDRFEHGGTNDRQSFDNDPGHHRNGYHQPESGFRENANGSKDDPYTDRRESRGGAGYEGDDRDRRGSEHYRQGQDRGAYDGKDHNGQARNGQYHDRGSRDNEGDGNGKHGNIGGTGKGERNGGGGGGGGGGGEGGGSGGWNSRNGVSVKSKNTSYDDDQSAKAKLKNTIKWGNDAEAAEEPLPEWKSEYQDVIGQTGMNIIRDRLHQHGGRSSGRKLLDRVILRCRA